MIARPNSVECLYYFPQYCSCPPTSRSAIYLPRLFISLFTVIGEGLCCEAWKISPSLLFWCITLQSYLTYFNFIFLMYKEMLPFLWGFHKKQSNKTYKISPLQLVSFLLVPSCLLKLEIKSANKIHKYKIWILWSQLSFAVVMIKQKRLWFTPRVFQHKCFYYILLE